MIWYFIVGFCCLGLGWLFGFVFSARAAGGTSSTLVRVSSIIGLSILVKCIENYSYANLVKLEALRKTGVFKEDSITLMIHAHEGIFREIVPYSDWRSAMRFLESNKELAILFKRGAES
jgi:hypothetical protein